MKKSEVVGYAAAIFLVILSFIYVVAPCQTNMWMEFTNHCNETYGEGNWIVVDGGHEARENVSTHIGPITIPYIGQMLECVPCNQT